MMHKTKDLSLEQKAAVEGLLGRPVSENETISIRSVSVETAPEWLNESWNLASRTGSDQMSAKEVDLEIAAARGDRRSRRQLLAQ